MNLGQYISPTLLATVTVLILSWIVLFFWKRNHNLPPGPWGWPLFGYYPFISEPTHEHFIELAKRYGNVFSFRTIGGNLVVVLNGAKAIKDVLINRADEFTGRSTANNVVAWLSDGIGITQEGGTAWKEQRRFFLQAAKSFGFGKTEVESEIHDEIRSMMDDIRKTNGEPIEMQFHVAHVNSSVVCQILFSKKFKKDDPDFKAILVGTHDTAKAFISKMNFMVGPLFTLIMEYSPHMQHSRKGKAALFNAARKLINEHIESFDPDHPKDYIDIYLKQREELRKKGELETSSFTMERLLANTVNVILEGTESVSFTTCNMLSLLSKHPQAQEEAQKELDAIVGRERMPSWTDRQNLPYIDALIQELYRFEAPFLVTTQYSNYVETMINGYRIPRYSLIVSNLYTINMDPVIFPDPEKFDPRRYLSEDGKKIKLEGPYPFGLGKRSCVGESLAQVEVFLVITALLQSFKLQPTNEYHTVRFIPRE